ncbi:hypothetical protein GOC67_27020 [Sinorhizobium medicae]|uniref:hypothetical protein n=1 Tax=Sinorhizobium medicae TaxID=110321 RepID=UPI00129543AE|nr:hypothetical protein [Sinorhizobium medicae]MDX0469419.1 hypothetical protein [Sinorhizobium medicae]MDX0475742.1 hypothetical protein [Sinorhizobium medicae]MDX1176547.1 hypothetical protein [Sinorhizobium medicae]MQV95454.1 hypothetical protein [Sinorhizobium medicae]
MGAESVSKCLGFPTESGIPRHTIFNFLAIQTDRMLSEQEVLEINWVTKQRAYRYVAAAEKGWLYPEREEPALAEAWRRLPVHA